MSKYKRIKSRRIIPFQTHTKPIVWKVNDIIFSLLIRLINWNLKLGKMFRNFIVFYYESHCHRTLKLNSVSLRNQLWISYYKQNWKLTLNLFMHDPKAESTTISTTITTSLQDNSNSSWASFVIFSLESFTVQPIIHWTKDHQESFVSLTLGFLKNISDQFLLAFWSLPKTDPTSTPSFKFLQLIEWTATNKET